MDRCSAGEESGAGAREPGGKSQTGLKPVAVVYAVTAPRDPHHRSTVGVIGVIAAQLAQLFVAGVDPTSQATALVCKPLRPSMVMWSRLRRQQGVVCALNLVHEVYGAAPPAPFE